MSVRTNPEVHFPDVRVTLVGTDGNAFAVLGKVRRALSARWRYAGPGGGVHGRGYERRLRPLAGYLHGLGGRVMTDAAAKRYPRQPRVGDVIEVYVGLVTVESVHNRGRDLYVRDGQGRRLFVRRAERGCWFRPGAEVAAS